MVRRRNHEGNKQVAGISFKWWPIPVHNQIIPQVSLNYLHTSRPGQQILTQAITQPIPENVEPAAEGDGQ